MNRLPIRLIATDMDGTLLDHRGQIPPENVRAVLEAQKRGVTVAIATGRFPENGACIVDERLRLLAMRVMDMAAAARTLDIILAAGADSFIFGHKIICTTRPDAHHHSELSQRDRIVRLGIGYTHGPEAARDMLRGPVHKFYICGSVPLEPIRRALIR